MIEVKTAYDIIANCLKLEKANDNIYVSPEGKRFIQTKYGFEPVEKSNTDIILTENKTLIKELTENVEIYKAENDYLRKSNIEYLKTIDNLKTKNKNQLEIIISNKSKVPLLNDEIEKLKKENNNYLKTINDTKIKVSKIHNAITNINYEKNNHFDIVNSLKTKNEKLTAVIETQNIRITNLNTKLDNKLNNFVLTLKKFTKNVNKGLDSVRKSLNIQNALMKESYTRIKNFTEITDVKTILSISDNQPLNENGFKEVENILNKQICEFIDLSDTINNTNTKLLQLVGEAILENDEL